jgi:hypothetical protein
MSSKIGIAAATVLGATALFVSASSFGRDGGTGAADRKLHGEPSQLASAARGQVTAARARGLRVRYRESNATTLGPGASDGYSFTCPKSTPRAVAGYGGTARSENAGDIVIADSTPFRNGRSWSVGVKNLSNQPREFYVGIVCIG